MKLPGTAVLLVLFSGCVTAQGTGGSGPSPSPGIRPATKKELPWLKVPGGQLKTTLYYGPWQCRREFMTGCQKECLQQGYQLMGCMWLVDIKLDWEGRLIALPIPVAGGSRYAVYHCCCNYPVLPKVKKEAERKRWDNIRDTFREKWSKKFGDWPTENGPSWPGHHIRDLWHGGDPVDPNNIIPAQPDVHKVFNDQYPVCYDGKAPWNTAGVDLPYTDH
jgi:hypothetical protein